MLRFFFSTLYFRFTFYSSILHELISTTNGTHFFFFNSLSLIYTFLRFLRFVFIRLTLFFLTFLLFLFLAASFFLRFSVLLLLYSVFLFCPSLPLFRLVCTVALALVSPCKPVFHLSPSLPLPSTPNASVASQLS